MNVVICSLHEMISLLSLLFFKFQALSTFFNMSVVLGLPFNFFSKKGSPSITMFNCNVLFQVAFGVVNFVRG